MKSAFVCGFNSHFADSTYFLRNPLTSAESRTINYIYVTVFVSSEILLVKSLTFWNMFKDLSLESRNIQTQYYAPIQCTVWPRNEMIKNKRFFCRKNINFYIKKMKKIKFCCEGFSRFYNRQVLSSSGLVQFF